MFKPSGIYPAIMTPFREDNSINEKVLRQMVDFYIDKGLHGLFPVSSVGEFVHMSMEQAFEVMEIVVDQAKGKVPVTPGVSSTCAANSVKLAQKAESIGCQGVVICPPYYYPINQENMEKHFEIVADSINIPVILYNIPLFATPISSDVIARLSRKKNIVGIKDSSGSLVELMHSMDKVRLMGSQMSFLIGREEMLAATLPFGVSGSMTSSAGIIPEIMVGIWNAHHNGEFAKANRLQTAMLSLVRQMFAVPFPIGFKTALELRGFPMGAPRQPLAPAEEANWHKVRADIEKTLKDLLDLIAREKLDTKNSMASI